MQTYIYEVQPMGQVPETVSYGGEFLLSHVGGAIGSYLKGQPLARQ